MHVPFVFHSILSLYLFYWRNLSPVLQVKWIHSKEMHHIPLLGFKSLPAHVEAPQPRPPPPALGTLAGERSRGSLRAPPSLPPPPHTGALSAPASSPLFGDPFWLSLSDSYLTLRVRGLGSCFNPDTPFGLQEEALPQSLDPQNPISQHPKERGALLRALSKVQCPGA